MREDDYFKQALGIGIIPSAERLWQRLDESGTCLIPTINRCSRAHQTATAFRADSGNDALDTMVALEDAENTHYIVKWNPRQNDPIVWRYTVFAQGDVKTPST